MKYLLDPVHVLPHRVKMASLICTVQDHRDDVNCCAFSASLLATCSADKTVRVYSTRDFSELPFSPLSGHGYGVHCCCFSPCGQYLASCSTDATTMVWAMTSGEIHAMLQHPGRSPVRVCAFSPDSSCLISASSDGTVALWDFPSRTLRRSAQVQFTPRAVLAAKMLSFRQQNRIPNTSKLHQIKI